MPCGRFGANAAWLRLALLAHNVLTGLKRIALRPEWLEARLKRLPFHFFFYSPGKLIHHARRLASQRERFEERVFRRSAGGGCRTVGA